MSDLPDLSKCTPDIFVSERRQYLNYFENYSNWSKVPLLNYGDVNVEHPQQSLVRYRGMVQNMRDTEIYYEYYEIQESPSALLKTLCGKYRDIRIKKDDIFLPNSSKNLKSEREVIDLVPVPGLNDWVIKMEQEIMQKASSNSDENENKTSTNLVGTKKIKMENQNASDLKSTSNLESTPDLENTPVLKKINKLCTARIYDNSKDFKMRDIIDVIGFLSTINNNAQGHIYIHVICYKILYHCNPLLDPTQLFMNKRLRGRAPRPIQEGYNRLHEILTYVLFGDSLAAEYVIFNLISRYNESLKRYVQPTFNLNIVNFPSEEEMPNIKSYMKFLCNFLSTLVPNSCTVNLTNDELNSRTLVSKKDYETGCLIQGDLQLSNGTNLFINEVELEEIMIGATGVNNIFALKNMLNRYVIGYEFMFQKVYHDCDVPALVFSKQKSILRVANYIPLKINENMKKQFAENLPDPNGMLFEEALTSIRRFITMMKCSQFEFNPNIIEGFGYTVFNEMIDFDIHELSTYLTVCKLYSISRGLKKMTRTSWAASRKLEEERRSRHSYVFMCRHSDAFHET